MAEQDILTAERLRELFNYDPDTGHFTRLVPRNGRRGRIGDVVGTPCGQGYLQMRVDKRNYQAHRLAWLYMTGEWPTSHVDHRDTDKTNNRWLNLRAATQSQNIANSRTPKDNTSGFKGVGRRSDSRRWTARITKNRRLTYLGSFDTAEEARAAYARAATELFGDFARTE